jgi:bifunctional DNA-binding transcriptional regulator/antitoxin component of YhaV-PrlF toxin-antitoxin module
MDVSATLTMEQDGKITLPDTVRDRYQLQPGTPLRISRRTMAFCSCH